MAETLASLRDQARLRADMQNSKFVSDAEFNQYISDSYAELYDLLVSKFEDYYTADPLVFHVDSGNTYDLPVDFYKLKGLDRALSDSNDWYTLRPFTFEDRNARRSATRFRGLYPAIRYRIFGNKILFSPDDQAAGNYRMWYIPRYTPLVNDTDTVEDVIGWEVYIVVDAAMKALQKEESDISVIMAMKQALIARIDTMAANRDVGEPDRVTDISLHNFDSDFYPWR
jgi:hypothetical protein